MIGYCGSLGTNAHVVHDHGIDAIFSVLSRTCNIEDAMAEARVQRAQRSTQCGRHAGHRAAHPRDAPSSPVPHA